MSRTQRPLRSQNARPFFSSLYFTPKASSRRSRLSTIIAASVAALLAVGAVAVGVAAPASAHTGAVSGIANCQPDGTYAVTWTYNQTNTPTSGDGSQSDVVVTTLAPAASVLVGAGIDGQKWLNATTDHASATTTTVSELGNYTRTFVQTGIAGTAKSATATVQTTWLNWGSATNNVGTVALSGCGIKAPECIPTSAVSYTYDALANSGNITVTNPTANPAATLCQPLYVTAASWKYLTTDLWPQKLDTVNFANNKKAITTAGTYAFGAPVTCGQGDIYASLTGFIDPAVSSAPSNIINGGQGWEWFLSYMGFTAIPSTTGPTYMSTPSGCVGEVTNVAPAVTTVQGCGVYGSVTPAVNEGVNYAVVFDKVTGDYTVTATPKTGFHFVNNETKKVFTGSVGAYKECAPNQPPPVTTHSSSETPPSCTTNTVTVTTTDTTSTWVFVQSSNSWVAGDPIVTTSTATRVLTPTETEKCLVAPLDPSASAEQCNVDDQPATMLAGALTVVPMTGVVYTVHTDSLVAGSSSTAATSTAALSTPKDVVLTAAKTTFAPGTYTVTAAALPGYTLWTGGPATWNLSIASAEPCGQLDDHALADGGVVAADQTCSTGNGLVGGSITVDNSAGLDYSIAGVKLTASKITVAPGTYVVTGVPQDGFTFDGDPWTVTVGSANSNCLAGLATLAFTGFSGGFGYIAMAGLLLMLGGAFIAWSRLSNRRTA